MSGPRSAQLRAEERATQAARQITVGGQSMPGVDPTHECVGDPQIVRDAARVELTGLPGLSPAVIDFIEGLTVVGFHHSLLTSARAVTRHVTGAILTASRWLHRKAWTRRAASPARPSGTTNGGAQ